MSTTPEQAPPIDPEILPGLRDSPAGRSLIGKHLDLFRNMRTEYIARNGPTLAKLEETATAARATYTAHMANLETAIAQCESALLESTGKLIA